MGKQIAIAPGTKVSFAWETEAGVRPTSDYVIWEECTTTPDFNNARDQIETTTLLQENNHTYTPGLRDFGDLEFGSNFTNDVLDLFIGTDGYVTKYADNIASGLNLWVCVDAKALNKSYFVPVQPQDFAMPGLEAGSNKADLVVYFTAVGDAVWADDPIYSTETTHTATITGYVSTGVTLNIMQDNKIIRTLVTSATSTTAVLPAGEYIVVASLDNETTQVRDLDLSSANATVSFSSFA